MIKRITIGVLCGVLVGVGIFLVHQTLQKEGAPPYDITFNEREDMDRFSQAQRLAATWKRPEGPAKVGLQVGHWKNDELPEELHRLEGSTGASGGGKTEWEVNLAIAQETQKILETQGVSVDILPAAIPQQYWADAFVAIHADGNANTSVSGFKAAAPRRDLSSNAQQLLSAVEEAYDAATDLTKDPNVSRNMRGYYAFAWWRFDHAIHPMTPGIIIETGFLTNPADRRLIVDNPRRAAEGVAAGVLAFLANQQLLP